MQRSDLYLNPFHYCFVDFLCTRHVSLLTCQFALNAHLMLFACMQRNVAFAPDLYVKWQYNILYRPDILAVGVQKARVTVVEIRALLLYELCC